MAEDEEPKPEASQAAPPAPIAAPEPPVAPPASPAPLTSPAPPASPAPPNRLHEWGAALGIMVFLAIVLWVFLSFLRSASL